MKSKSSKTQSNKEKIPPPFSTDKFIGKPEDVTFTFQPISQTDERSAIKPKQ